MDTQTGTVEVGRKRQVMKEKMKVVNVEGRDTQKKQILFDGLYKY